MKVLMKLTNTRWNRAASSGTARLRKSLECHQSERETLLADDKAPLAVLDRRREAQKAALACNGAPTLLVLVPLTSP